jgi:tetratricopeptide (TPR) repeat protein
MIPRRWLVSIPLALLVSATFAAHVPAATDPAAIVAAKKALNTAVTTGKAPDVLSARATFASLSAVDPKSGLLHTWVATADWRVVPRLMSTDKPQAEKYCKDGLAHADQALKLDSKNAEALAIKASLNGLSLTFNPGAMMTIGPEIDQELSRAQSLAPKNPRVQLLKAISTLNKPAFVGGGASPALKEFEKAQELFAAETVTDPTAPDWGRDDAFVWAGRAEMKLDQPAKAREQYQKALEVTPDHAWVKYSLLPEAEKALASATQDADKDKKTP